MNWPAISGHHRKKKKRCLIENFKVKLEKAA